MGEMVGGRFQTAPTGGRALGLAVLQIDFDPDPDFDTDIPGLVYLAVGRACGRPSFGGISQPGRKGWV